MKQETSAMNDALRTFVGIYPFIGDVIDQLKIGRTAFYRYFPPDRIRELRREHSEVKE